MKSKVIICAIVALSLAPTGFAFSQGKSDRGDRGDRGRGEQGQRDSRDNDGRGGDRGDNRDSRGENRGNDMRRDDRPGVRGNSYEHRRDGRGAGPSHQYYRGDRLPAEYRHRQYVVDDWRGHRLSAPPRGYHWVQTGNDYVLVAIASGIILQLFFGN